MAVSLSSTSRTGFLAPDQEAELLASHMIKAHDVMAAVLEETVETAERGRAQEAGRTVCGSLSDVRLPHRRFPRAVQLAECPVTQSVGIVHTHSTRDELRRPTNSIADIANVAFEGVAVQGVIGTQSAEFILAPTDLAAMQQTVRDTLGVPVSSQREIVAAVIAGHVDPIAARDRLGMELSPLIRVVPTGFAEMDHRVAEIPEAAFRAGQRPVPGLQSHVHGCHQITDLASPDIGKLRERSRRAADAVEMGVRRVASEGFDEAIGIVVGTLVSRLIGLS